MKELIKKIHSLLADIRVLTFKTQMYHWNVSGRAFYPLHTMFQEQYEDLFTSQDDIAEKIRQCGFFVTGSLVTDSVLTTENVDERDAENMLKNLILDHNVVIKTINDIIEETKKVNDEALLNYFADRLDIHKKHVWFLKSSI